MKCLSYNKIVGQSVDQLANISNNIFAVVMTLLVLNLHVPVIADIHREGDLCRTLVALMPNAVMFAMSFLTLGIFWVGQQAQLNYFSRGDRNLAWIHIAFLFAVCAVPFTTKLMAEFITYRITLVIYWANLVALGGILYASWRYAGRHKLLKDDVAADVDAAFKKRIVVGQALYAFGTLLRLINTYWSIGFIVLVQLNYAIAPRFGRFLG